MAGIDAEMPVRTGIWCAFFLLVLLLFASLGWFAFPIADDHSYFLDYGTRDYWDVAKHVYFLSSGRYLSTYLLTFLSRYVDTLAVYHSLALCLILLLTAPLYFLVGSCHRGKPRETLAMTLCLAAAFLAGMPSPSQGLYWMSGAFTFFPAFIAVFVFLGALCRLAFCPAARPLPLVAVAAAGIFVCMGCNELTAAAGMFFLALASVAARRTGNGRKNTIAMLALWGFVLMCFSFSAPGNFMRSGSMAAERPWEWGYMLNVAGGTFEGFKWILRTPVLPAVLFCLVFLEPRWFSGLPRHTAAKRFAVWLVLTCALFFGEFLLVYVSSKRAPYARMNNAIFHAAFTMALIGGALMYGELRRVLRAGYEKAGKTAVFTGIGILLAASILLQPSVSASVRNYANGEFAAYRAIWLERLAMLPPREKAGGVVLTLPALHSRPFPLVFRDLVETQDKHQWIPEVFARYHGLKGIVVAPRPGGH